jgi:hypothetical protein
MGVTSSKPDDRSSCFVWSFGISSDADDGSSVRSTRAAPSSVLLSSSSDLERFEVRMYRYLRQHVATVMNQFSNELVRIIASYLKCDPIYTILFV